MKLPPVPKMSHCFLLDQLPFDSASPSWSHQDFFLAFKPAGLLLSLAFSWNGKSFERRTKLRGQLFAKNFFLMHTVLYRSWASFTKFL